MDHTEAIRSNAAERYSIGDLPVSEVEEFERHFFECPQCSEELRVLSILAENAKAVFAERERPVAAPVSPPPEKAAPSSPTTWWKQPWFLIPAFATVVIASLAVYQSQQVSQLRELASAVRPMSAHPLYAASRGEETVVAPARGEKFYAVYLDKTWESDEASYRGVIRDESGKTSSYSFDIAAPQAGGTIYILLPVGALGSGRYNLVIQGKDKELAHYPFTLRIQ